MSTISVSNVKHESSASNNLVLTSGGDTQVIGALGLGGATYGTSGQVLTSAGSGSTPTWTTPTSLSNAEDGTGTNFEFNSGFGSNGVAYGIRAWIDFDGTPGTPVTNGSGNMDALTDNADGDYTLNFTNNMPDANYAVLFGIERDAANYIPNAWTQSRLVGSVDIYSGLVNAGSTLIPWDLVIFAAIVR